MTDIINGWIVNLLTGDKVPVPGIEPIPSQIKWITCQHQACVLAKGDVEKANITYSTP